jgi:hypothetical protein
MIRNVKDGNITSADKEFNLLTAPRNVARLRDGGIDAGLFLLELVTLRGMELTQEEIAFVCGCSRGYIFLLEKSAREK